MTLTRHGQSAERGSGGPAPRTRPRDGRGDQRSARSVVRGMSLRMCGGEGERRPAAANVVEGPEISAPREQPGGGDVTLADAAAERLRISALRADGRAGCVAADVRRGGGAEARRRGGHQHPTRMAAGEHRRGRAAGREENGPSPIKTLKDGRGKCRPARTTA